MNSQAEGKYSKPSKGGYARVLIELDLSAAGVAIEIDLDDHEWNQQLRDGNFTDWLDAAIYGVGFALGVANVGNAHVVIRRIVGLLVDTTPTTVAAASADAAWRAINFVPSDLLVAHIEQATTAGGKPPWQLMQFGGALPADLGSFHTEQPN